MESGREKIIDLSIPDEDLPNWMREMQDAGLSNEELDRFFARLNKTYRDELYGEEKEALKDYLENFFKARGLAMSEERFDSLADSIIKSRLDRGLEIKKPL